MKKVLYVLGSVEIILSFLVFAAVDIMKASFPLLGRIAFQFAMAGSYTQSDYAFAAPIATVIAVILLCAGVAQIVMALFLKEKN